MGNLHIDKTITTSGSELLGGIQSPSDIESPSKETIKFTFEKGSEIPEDIKLVMMKNGFNPDVDADVVRWNALPENEKTNLIAKYYEETQLPVTKEEKVDSKVPENWTSMSAVDKEKLVFEAMGKKKYPDWDSKSKEEQDRLIDEGLVELCTQMDPDFKYLSEKDRAKSIKSAKATFAYLLENADPQKLGRGGLIEAYNGLKNEDKSVLRNKLKTIKKELDYELTPQDKARIDTILTVKQYFGLSDTEKPTGRQFLDYYKHLEAGGRSLTESQKADYDILVQIDQIDPSSLDRVDDEQNVLTSITEVFSAKGRSYILNDEKTGLSRKYSDTNMQAFLAGFKEKFGDTKNLADDSEELQTKIDEFTEIYKGLSYAERKFVLTSLFKDNNFDMRFTNGIKAHSAEQVVAANDEGISVERQNNALNVHHQNLLERKANGEEIDASGYDVYVAQAEGFHTETKGQHLYNATELGEEAVISSQNAMKKYASNYMEIFDYADNLVHNSDNISDEMKEFYARNSVEIMDTPEERQMRANSLGQYDSESFNRGVSDGLASNYPNSSSQQSEGVAQNSSQIAVSKPVQEALKSFDLLADGNDLSIADAVKMFEKLTQKEQEELLAVISERQLDRLPIEICDRFPKLIEAFVDNGKGIKVITECSSIGTAYKAIQLMSSKPGTPKKQLGDFASDPRNRAIISNITYNSLVESGSIKNVDPNAHLNTYKA